MTANVTCLSCGAAGRFWVRKAERDVYRCSRCGLVWVPDGLVRGDDGASIYEGETPIFLQDGNEQYYLDETNLRSCREKLAWVQSHLAPGAGLLDVGANFGHFLSVAAKTYRAVGVELSEAAVKWSREHFGVDNHAASIDALPADLRGPWDAITLWDVIEHVPDPASALRALRGALRVGGRLFLSTPDAGSRVARALGKRWHYLDPIQHIVLFERSNLTKVLGDAGFEVLEVRTFGYYYRVGYVLDRLAYLHRGGVLGRGARVAQRLGKPLSQATTYINLRDVMGVHAVARA